MLVYEIHLADNYSWFNMHSLLSEGKKCLQLFWQNEEKYVFSHTKATQNGTCSLITEDCAFCNNKGKGYKGGETSLALLLDQYKDPGVSILTHFNSVATRHFCTTVQSWTSLSGRALKSYVKIYFMTPVKLISYL